MQPFAISRVLVHVVQILGWIAGAIASLTAASLLPLLAAAFAHALLVGVDALIAIAREMAAQGLRADISSSHLKRIADVQAAALERRNAG